MNRAAAISKLPRTRLSDQAAQQLKRLIAQGAFPPGSKLPTELELAAQLGVTRLTVREALFQVEAAGFAKTLHGSGTYVVDPGERATLQLLAEMLVAGRALSPEEALALMQLREVVVRGFVPFLVQKATAVHLTALRGAVAEERAAARDPVRLAEADYRFNEELARATGNVFFTLLMRSVREAHVHLGEIIYRDLGDDGAIAATKQAVLTALEARQEKKLERHLATYLTGGTRLIEAWAARGGTPLKRRKRTEK